MQQLEPHARGFTLVEIAIVLLIISVLLGTILVPLGGAFEQSQRKTTSAQLEEIIEALIGFAITRSRLPCPATGGQNTRGEEVLVDPDPATTDGQCAQNHGFVPVSTLGLVGETNADGLLIDAWNNPIRYSVTNVNHAAEGDTNVFDFTYAGEIKNVGISNLTPGLVICTSATTNINCPENGDGNSLRANQVPAVVFSMGKDWVDYNGADQLANAGEGIDGGGNFDNDLTGHYTSIDYPVAGNDVFVAKSFTQIDGDEKFDDIVVWLPENILYTRMLQAGILP